MADALWGWTLMIAGDAVVGYVRVSTDRQGETGYGLADQTAVIENECAYRGLRLLGIEQDVASGATTKRRPGMERAIRTCERGEAQGVIAAKLDRLSRSVVDFAKLLERAKNGGWNVIVMDPSVDLATPGGAMIVNIMASVAQWERDIISERTTRALAQAKRNGVVLGRPTVLTAKTQRRVLALRDKGWSYETIASYLNDHGVTTDSGFPFYANTIQRACLSPRTAVRSGRAHAD
jgi:DNA invertase Pin-like site-specific DNA recombinase